MKFRFPQSSVIHILLKRIKNNRFCSNRAGALVAESATVIPLMIIITLISIVTGVLFFQNLIWEARQQRLAIICSEWATEDFRSLNSGVIDFKSGTTLSLYSDWSLDWLGGGNSEKENYIAEVIGNSNVAQRFFKNTISNNSNTSEINLTNNILFKALYIKYNKPFWVQNGKVSCIRNDPAEFVRSTDFVAKGINSIISLVKDIKK